MFEEVDFAFTQSPKNLERIIELATLAFFKNHEITETAFDQTPIRHKHTFEYLFREYVCDTLEEISRQNGCFFIAKQGDDIIGISLGREYGKSAVSNAFINLVSHFPTSFKEIMNDWWKLMEKFQLSAGESLPVLVYHQTLIAIDPQYAGKGIGTNLTEYVMHTIKERGFKALAIETSSLRAHRMVDNLNERGINVLPIDSLLSSQTDCSLIFQLLIPEAVVDKSVIEWFQSKAKK